MKPLIIYHANCADGFGAAFTAWLKLGDDADYVPMNYLDADTPPEENWGKLTAAIPDGANSGRDVYILDFSLPKQIMNRLFEISDHVTWLDHHKTAFEMWCPKHNHQLFTQDEYGDGINPVCCCIVLNNNKSGTMLAWEHFHHGTTIPLLIRHIDDYDRWQFKIEGTKEFNKALWSYAPWTFQQWKKGIEEDWGMSMYSEGAAILRAHNQNVQAVVKGAARKCTIDLSPAVSGVHLRGTEYSGLAANCPPHLQSDVGHELANQSCTFGLLWFINKDGLPLCSLRSNGDYDVSTIAKAFGGGGHKNAAGFTAPSIEMLLSWIK